MPIYSQTPIMPKYRVGILGATGVVGQRFITLLSDHPWFKITRFAASERSSGKTYIDSVQWRLDIPIPQEYINCMIYPCEVDLFKNECDLILSGLNASIAGPIETAFAMSGFPVFSNAKSHRYDVHVPILIPFINPDHIEMIRQQSTFSSGGFIITNGNCASIGLSIALAPLLKEFHDISSIVVSSLQAISGAGYPGVPALDILDNVIPYIDGEEDKLELEPTIMLGHVDTSCCLPIDSCKCLKRRPMTISATCHRVPVTDGHLLSVSVELNKKFIDYPEQVMQRAIHAWKHFPVSPISIQQLPSCPSNIIQLCFEKDRPQPRLDRQEGHGMTVVIGRIRPCPVFHLRFTTTSHNTILGAAGTTILNAEFAIMKGFIKSCIPSIT